MERPSLGVRLARGTAWGILLFIFAACNVLTLAVLYAAVVLRAPSAATAAALYAVWLAYDWRTPFAGGRHASRRYALPFFRWLLAHGRASFPATVRVDRERVPLRFAGGALLEHAPSSGDDSLLPFGASLGDDSSCDAAAPEGKRTRATIVACHPHGVWPFGMLSTLLLDSARSELEGPAVVLTLAVQFAVPIWREMLLDAGLAVADASAIRTLLARGTSVVIALGGASEALVARPGVMELVVRRRRGVFRLALQTGAAIRPALTIGENDLYWQPQWRVLRPFQRLCLYVLGLPFPMAFWARGSLIGLVPCDRPLHTVIGARIEPPGVFAHPTDAQILEMQRRYVSAIVDLHARYSRGSSVLLIT